MAEVETNRSTATLVRDYASELCVIPSLSKRGKE